MKRLYPTMLLAPAAIMPVVRMLAAAALSAALSGCYGATVREAVNEPVNEPVDYRQRHPIVIQEKDQTVELFIGDNRGELLPADRAAVLAFASAWKREASGGVVIEVPVGTANERASHEAVREIRSLLAASGVPGQGIVLRPYRPRDPRRFATVRLNYPRVAADAGPCGLWPKDIGPSDFRENVENRPYWNFGCASQRNLATMVDNPADLVEARGETDAYRARRTIMLDKYHKGESTASTYVNADKGKISDVGQ
jgi:pilus assembly protein CpaD